MIAWALMLAATAASAGTSNRIHRTVVGFGSCSHQSRSQDFWSPLLAHQPDYFVFGGDNIYSDTYDMALQWKKYQQLADLKGFQQLKKQSVLLATGDDHDYGLNDSGEEFREKTGSRENFFRFWNVPKNSPRRSNPGVCDARIIDIDGNRLQFILLDTRFFRSELVKKAVREEGEGRYEPNNRKGSTILGDAQWTWLEEQLRKPADIRLIVSSIQVVPEDHAWECWNNFPHERKRLFNLIKSTKAEGVLFLTGDRHMAELSKLTNTPARYPLYDLTSSGLNMGRGGHWPEPNRHRIGEQFFENNFGLVIIDWAKDPRITLEVRDTNDRVVIHHEVRLSELQIRRRR